MDPLVAYDMINLLICVCSSYVELATLNIAILAMPQ